jgi:hypothetical protein
MDEEASDHSPVDKPVPTTKNSSPPARPASSTIRPSSPPARSSSPPPVSTQEHFANGTNKNSGMVLKAQKQKSLPPKKEKLDVVRLPKQTSTTTPTTTSTSPRAATSKVSNVVAEVNEVWKAWDEETPGKKD